MCFWLNFQESLEMVTIAQSSIVDQVKILKMFKLFGSCWWDSQQEEVPESILHLSWQKISHFTLTVNCRPNWMTGNWSHWYHNLLMLSKCRRKTRSGSNVVMILMILLWSVGSRSQIRQQHLLIVTISFKQHHCSGGTHPGDGGLVVILILTKYSSLIDNY